MINLWGYQVYLNAIHSFKGLERPQSPFLCLICVIENLKVKQNFPGRNEFLRVNEKTGRIVVVDISTYIIENLNPIVLTEDFAELPKNESNRIVKKLREKFQFEYSAMIERLMEYIKYGRRNSASVQVSAQFILSPKNRILQWTFFQIARSQKSAIRRRIELICIFQK